MNQKLLSSIETMLNTEATNYVVFLKSYSVAANDLDNSAAYIHQALGDHIVVENLSLITPTILIEKINSAISYEGDASSGPDVEILKSLEFSSLKNEFLLNLKFLATNAKKIEEFWVSDGHPAYPVFWDFAFLIVGPIDSVVIIGSASD